MAVIIGSIQIAKKTKSAWTIQNPTLLAGQMVAEVDGSKMLLKYGDGSTGYTSLSYVTVRDTDVVAEGSVNLYYTNARVTAHADTLYYRKSVIDGMFADGIKTPTPIDCNSNPNYPASAKGISYKVSVAGKIGGASGIVVEVGDLIVASVASAGGTQAAVGADFGIYQTNIDKATEIVFGTARRATSGEGNGGTDDEAYMTSLKVKNFGDGRYLKLSGGTLTGSIAGTVATFTTLHVNSVGLSGKLNVGGVDGTTSYISTILNAGTSGYGSFIQFTDGAVYNMAVGTKPGGDFAFYVGRFPGQSGTEVATITQAGGVTGKTIRGLNSSLDYSIEAANNNSTGNGDQNYIKLTDGGTTIGYIKRPGATNDIEINAGYGSLKFGTGTAGTPTVGLTLNTVGNVIVGAGSGASLGTNGNLDVQKDIGFHGTSGYGIVAGASRTVEFYNAKTIINTNLGLGTASPNVKLEIAGAGATADPLMLRLSNAANTGFYWDLWRDNTTGHFKIGSAVGGAKTAYLTLDSTDGSLSVPKVNSLENAFFNITSGSTSVLFTASASQSYLVYVTQGANSYQVTALVSVAEGSGTAEIAIISQTNANLSLSVSGLNVRATNGTGNTVTVKLTYLRIR